MHSISVLAALAVTAASLPLDARSESNIDLEARQDWVQSLRNDPFLGSPGSVIESKPVSKEWNTTTAPATVILTTSASSKPQGEHAETVRTTPAQYATPTVTPTNATIPECPEETAIDFPFGWPFIGHGPVIADRDDDDDNGCPYGVCNGLTMLVSTHATPTPTSTPSIARIPSCTPKRKTTTHSTPKATSIPTCRPRVNHGPALNATASEHALPFCNEITASSLPTSTLPFGMLSGIVSDLCTEVVTSAVGPLATYMASQVGSAESFVTSLVSEAPVVTSLVSGSEY